MANYTVTLAEIIRDMADPKIPSYDFSGLIKDTWEKIVPTKFPMWEEDTGMVDANGFPVTVVPRERLVCKILAHYFTWEIGYENQNMWLFAFNRKLSEIMPYYVQLEKTMGIDFNPFITTDIEERFGGENGKNIISTGEETTTTDQNTEHAKTFSENNSFNGEKTNHLTDAGSNSETDDTVAANSSVKTGTEKVDTIYTTDNKNTSSTEYGKIETVSGSNSKDGTTKVTDTTTKDSTTTIKDTTTVNSDTSVKYGSTNTHTKTGTVVEDSDDWNKFSATPQGTLTDVETGRYLTDARKVENDKTTTYNTTDIDKKTGTDTTTVEETTTKNGSNKIDESVTKNGNTTVNETEDSNSSTKFTGTDTVTTSDKKKENTNVTTTYDTTVTDNGNEKITKTGSYQKAEDGTITDKNTGEKTGSENGSVKENISNNKNTSGTSKETGNETYLKTIKGRNSQNIVDQIEKWRELIVNIEMMIINDMQDLFMQVF